MLVGTYISVAESVESGGAGVVDLDEVGSGFSVAITGGSVLYAGGSDADDGSSDELGVVVVAGGGGGE
jgi:hypothetical protein